MSEIRDIKKVLIIAYHYPPSNAVGAVRPSKFARYLPEFGWEPTVLTVTTKNTEPVDRDQKTEIWRVAEWPHPLKSYENLRRQLAKRRGRSEEFELYTRASHKEALHPQFQGFARFKRWLLAFFWCPDRETGWLLPSIFRGFLLIRNKQIKCLITTGPPFTCHLVGLVLNFLTGIQWVADFRDPWSLNVKFPLLRNRVTDFMEMRLIRSVMAQADLVVSVTPGLTESALKEHSDVEPTKFVTLTNGFDPLELKDLSVVRPAPRPTIFSYIGTFYMGQSPEMFLKALRSLLDDGSLKDKDVRVKFFGNVSYAEGLYVPNFVRELKLEEIVEIGPFVKRQEALLLNLQTHVALVLTENYAFSSKLYNALACGSIIFNIGSSVEISELLAKTGRGVSANAQSLPDVRRGILECMRRSLTGESQKPSDASNDPRIQPFDFRHLTGRLSNHLEQLS